MTLVLTDVSDLSRKPLLRGWSHVVAVVVLTCLGLVMILSADAGGRQRAWLSVYVAGTAAMFGVSAAYHRLRWSAAAASVMQRLDHSTIFLAIAGAYTPIATTCLESWQRPAVLATVWGGAVVGITLQWLPVRVPRRVFAAVYVIVGWSMAPAMPQLFQGIGGTGFGLVLAGGLAYTIGAVIYALKRPDPWPTVFGFHEVFHACTIVGASLHLAAIALVVVPRF